jgi:hypothetical protein
VKQVTATRQQCNQWVKKADELGWRTGMLEPCCGPVAFQSGRAGQRYCQGCLDTQIAEAHRREAAAKRDLLRLYALQPAPAPRAAS